MKYLNYLNPYHYAAIFITWIARKERQSHLIAAVNEANKVNKETGKKMLVFNTEKGVRVISKQQLRKHRLQKIAGKAIYETRR